MIERQLEGKTTVPTQRVDCASCPVETQTPQELLRQKIVAELAGGALRDVDGLRLQAYGGLSAELTHRTGHDDASWQEHVIGVEFPPAELPLAARSYREGYGNTPEKWHHAVVTGEEYNRVVKTLIHAIEERTAQQ